MEKNQIRELYKVFNNKMAGMLMARGFVLLELRQRDGRNLYMFKTSEELLKAVEEIKLNL